MLFYIFYELWTRPNQGLDINITVKGKKKGRKQAKVYVRISYEKGIVMCKPCTGRLNAERYCKIIIPRIDDSIQNSVVQGQNVFYRIIS